MRFWITVACFAFFNLLAWVAWCSWQAGRVGTIRIEPEENLLIADRRTMVWRFPVEMETVISEAPGRVVPQVAGRWSWADPKTLVFCAEKPLPLATPFQTTLLKNQLRSFQGLRFAGDVVRTYHTQELRLTHARIPEVLDDGQFLIELGFSDSVVPAEVAAKLSIKDAKGNFLKCTVFAEETLVEDSASGQEKTRSLVRFSVRPITEDQTGEYNLSLLLKPRLVGTSGPLGMTQEERRELCRPKSLRLERVSASCPMRGNPELYLHFSERIDTEVLRRALKVEPAVPFTISSCWQGAELRGAFQPGTRYVVSVLPRPSQEKIQTWPIADSLGVEVPDRHPGVWFDIKEGYLGSKGNRSILAHAVNVSEITVQVEKLVPEQVVAWCASGEIAPFAKTILTTQIPVPAGSNKIHDLRLSLDAILPNAGDGVYQFRIFVAPERVTVSRYDSYWIYDDVALVSLSDLALSAQSGPGGVHAWTLSLATAAPQFGVKLRAYSQKGQLLGESLSDAQGLAQIPCTLEKESPAFLLAERADPNQSSTSPALTWLDLRHNQLRDERVNTSGRPYLRQGYEAFVFTDRGVYRPGDTVHLRTLVRGPDGQTPKPFPLQIRVLRPDLRVWQTKTLLLDTGGDTETKLELPTDLPTGYWTIHCGLPGNDQSFGSTGFQIEDFLPDRLKTSLAIGKPGIRRIQQSTSASTIPCQVQGDWLFGQAAAGQATSLDIRLDPERFSPPDWKEWTFGDDSGTAQCLGEKPLIGQRLQTRKGVLDTKGSAQWNINVFQELSKADYYTPWRLTASAGVSEISGRTKTMTNTLSIDPVENYLGLRLSGGPKMSEPVQFHLAMVDTQGKQSATNCQVAITLLSETWESVLVEEKKTWRYESKRRLTPVGDSRFVTLSQGQGNLSLTIPNAGSYVLFARVPGTKHLCTLPFWIASDGWNRGSYCRQKPESCEIRLVRDDRVSATQALIIPPETDTDPKIWKTGESCALVIRSPFAGQVLVRVATDRVVHSTVITMQGTSAIVPLTVGRDWSPNAWILVSVVRPVEPDKPWRVHRAFGVTGIAVAQPERQALVQISPIKPVRSGEDLSCTISVSSSTGAAIANAALAVSIVDEGILSLTRFETPDPFAFFTAQRALTLSADDCYRNLMPEVPKGTSTVGGDTERTKSLGHKPPIASRRVKPVAFWHGNLRTDAQGQVQVQSTIPKTFAGQLRIMAIADAGPACGSSATTTVIRGPLVLQSSWPRALAPGDTFQVPIAVFSEIKSATVSFVVQAPEKLLRIVPCSGSIAVGSDGRGQTVLQATTLNALGSASISVMVQDTASSQTAWEELEIPIHPITPMETLGGEASATSGAVFRIQTQQGHLNGDTSQISLHIGPTPSLNIAWGIDTLYRYPYGCAEQTISSIFPLIALPDLAKQVGYISYSKEGLSERLRRGILRLQSMEVSGGGIAMWPGSPNVWPWASIAAAHLLCEAKRSGYSIPEDFLLRLLTFARQHADRHDEESLETSAYACYVLACAGRADLVILNRLTERLGPNTPPSAWLAAAWALAGRRDQAQKLLPRELPNLRSDRRLSDDLASPTRDLAIQVLAMVEATPQHPSLVQRVVDLSKRQTWYSTQDTAMAVFALGKYLQIAPKTAPYERIRLLVNGVVVAEEPQGKTIDWKGDPNSRIEIAVFGSATAAAHVSWIQTGIPFSPPPAQDHGLKVVRRWTTLQGVEIKPEQITVGDLIQVHLEVLSGAPRRHVVVEDILPAGMELENPRLSGTAQNDGQSHMNTLDLRDDRLIAVGDIRSASSPLTHTYLLRAVTAGTFTVPPVRAECMYDSSLTTISATGNTFIAPKSP